jgi:hypothetical protein
MFIMVVAATIHILCWTILNAIQHAILAICRLIAVKNLAVVVGVLKLVAFEI